MKLATFTRTNSVRTRLRLNHCVSGLLSGVTGLLLVKGHIPKHCQRHNRPKGWVISQVKNDQFRQNNLKLWLIVAKHGKKLLSSCCQVVSCPEAIAKAVLNISRKSKNMSWHLQQEPNQLSQLNSSKLLSESVSDKAAKQWLDSGPIKSIINSRHGCNCNNQGCTRRVSVQWFLCPGSTSQPVQYKEVLSHNNKVKCWCRLWCWCWRWRWRWVWSWCWCWCWYLCWCWYWCWCWSYHPVQLQEVLIYSSKVR